MIQGTMSGVGKSLLTAALCRIFRQDGYSAAPFKSQNMALNSFVTRDGGEMGRAQVLQAQAAGVEPDVRMNPILLKPSGDTVSQVIVHGKVRGEYRAADYFKMKKSLIPEILSAYESLAAEHDIIVIEGAGSPAEINLKADDIVNMGLARMVNAPVFLTGDIDPGGVFAQLFGTVALLEPQERERIAGLIINKFRGDIRLLKPGLSMLEDLTHLPVTGVIPWMKLDLDDEDSLSPRFSRNRKNRLLDIAIIRLPHISNFTDMTPLERHPAIGIRYVSEAGKLGTPDFLILPGTKNTLGDLHWLRETGLAEAVCSLSGRGIPVLGICGGYQMLGEKLIGTEGMLEKTDQLPNRKDQSNTGLGLLPVWTWFEPEKLQKQTTAIAQAPPFTGAVINGYQIHMGRTENRSCDAFSHLSDGTPEGAAAGLVFGTYLHGLFDSGQVTEALATWLMDRKGIPASRRPAPHIPETHWEYQERQLDLLADTVRASLDMDAIYRAVLDRGTSPLSNECGQGDVPPVQ